MTVSGTIATSQRQSKHRKGKTMSKEIKDVISQASRLMNRTEDETARYHAAQAIESAYDGELEDAYSALNTAYQMAA